MGIKDIAKLAGVSISTVSNVLNGKKNVGHETRDRVLKICEQQGYQPNFAGKSLKGGTTNTIVFNFSEFDREFYMKIIQGVSSYLSDNGFDLILCTHKSSRKFMNRSIASGGISLDHKMTDDVLVEIADSGFPVVSMDRHLEHHNIRSVTTDNYPVMCQFVQELVNRGYRDFGFLGGYEDSLDMQERYQAFLDTLEKNNIGFDHKNFFSGDYREQSGYQTAKIMILGNVLPQVLVCANDNMAIGAIRAFHNNGIRIPEQIAVTGFDDCSKAGIAGLTTVAIPRYESGYLAAKQLHQMIENSSPPHPIKINASIRWRNTVLEHVSR